MKDRTFKIVLHYQVHSEPGDGTRYDYHMIRVEGHGWRFVPVYETSIKYPDLIPDYIIESVQNKEVTDYDCEHEGVNPWTVRECRRAAIECLEREAK